MKAIDPMRCIAIVLAVSGLASVTPAFADPARLPHASPQSVGMNADHLRLIDQAVAEGLDAKLMPGCVVLVGRHGKVVHFQAYGNRRVEPDTRPMTRDTVFDIASITKPVATATSMMILLDRGRFRLKDRVSQHLPDFGQNEKGRITILELLTHQSGLIADNPLADYLQGPDEAWQRIWKLSPQNEPGTKFVYSDVNFLVLGELVRKLSGQSVADFARENIFQPLGMRETGFLPRQELKQRAAPTEQREGEWIQGEVHDPRAYHLGGVAGHAGLFSTAEDLAVYAQMMLNRGSYGGTRILSERAVATMTAAYPVSSGQRGLGWDMQTGYSLNRGELFTSQAFGHGGFTGTVLWIDPGLDMFVIFLSNRVHPAGKGLVNPLAGRIGSIAAAAIDDKVAGTLRVPSADNRSRSETATGHGTRSVPATIRTGIDVLQRDNFSLLKNRRVGLITNHTGLNREGTSTVELLHKAPNVKLVALFSPEHGIQGKLDVPNIADARDQATGLPIYSLYGESRRPTKESLQGIDTLVFDIQDIGARFYTYISTMGNAMQAAAEQKLRFVVLDRPNPINGVDVAGPLTDPGRESFIAFHRIPVRHGMTIGELARMFNSELSLGLDLRIVPVEGWRREEMFDATGLTWTNPSPNMRSLTQALLYPGIGLLETTNLSVGRGTDTPFEVIGAPWLDGRRLAEELRREALPGVTFVPVRFTPRESKFKETPCGGVNIVIINREQFEPLATGFALAAQLRKLYPQEWEAYAYLRLLVNREVHQALLDGRSATELLELSRDDVAGFVKRRGRFLLYPESSP
jgi:uncharacterized protein YbbC (DUF1343 family)/CubicO group peptidase (beta-lactamase class C family)